MYIQNITLNKPLHKNTPWPFATSPTRSTWLDSRTGALHIYIPSLPHKKEQTFYLIIYAFTSETRSKASSIRTRFNCRQRLSHRSREIKQNILKYFMLSNSLIESLLYLRHLHTPTWISGEEIYADMQSTNFGTINPQDDASKPNRICCFGKPFSSGSLRNPFLPCHTILLIGIVCSARLRHPIGASNNDAAASNEYL